LGILSERDIVRAIGQKGALALNDAVSQHMTAKVITTADEETVYETLEKMNAGRFRHLPVVNNGRLAGIVSIGDVVKYRLNEMEHEHIAMREYIATA
jgi:CBS domain-containing protein